MAIRPSEEQAFVDLVALTFAAEPNINPLNVKYALRKRNCKEVDRFSFPSETILIKELEKVSQLQVVKLMQIHDRYIVKMNGVISPDNKKQEKRIFKIEDQEYVLSLDQKMYRLSVFGWDVVSKEKARHFANNAGEGLYKAFFPEGTSMIAHFYYKKNKGDLNSKIQRIKGGDSIKLEWHIVGLRRANVFKPSIKKEQAIKASRAKKKEEKIKEREMTPLFSKMCRGRNHETSYTEVMEESNALVRVEDHQKGINEKESSQNLPTIDPGKNPEKDVQNLEMVVTPICVNTRRKGNKRFKLEKKREDNQPTVRVTPIAKNKKKETSFMISEESGDLEVDENLQKRNDAIVGRKIEMEIIEIHQSLPTNKNNKRAGGRLSNSPPYKIIATDEKEVSTQQKTDKDQKDSNRESDNDPVINENSQ